jgi:hypothetical protein
LLVLGGRPRRAENRYPLFGEPVGDAERERELGADDGESDFLGPREPEQSLYIRHLDIDALGVF